MSLFATKQPAVDLDELDQRIQEELHNQNKNYTAPYGGTGGAGAPIERKLVPLIAKAIKRLNYDEAVAMGDAIEALVKDGKTQTAAIQEWASGVSHE